MSRIRHGLRRFFLSSKNEKIKENSSKRKSLLKQEPRLRKKRLRSQDRFYLEEEGNRVVSAWQTGGRFPLKEMLESMGSRIPLPVTVNNYESVQVDFVVRPMYFSKLDSPKYAIRTAQEEPKVLHLSNHDVNNALDDIHIFIFESGSVVSWGLNGKNRQNLENFLSEHHNNAAGWPPPLKLWVSRRVWDFYRALKWNSPIAWRSCDLSIFEQDPSLHNTRASFDLDWEYVTTFRLRNKNKQREYDDFLDEEHTFRSVQGWSTDRVAEWLRARQLGGLEQVVREHHITGEVLRQITSEEIRTQLIPKDLGMQKRFRKELAKVTVHSKIFTETNQIKIDDFRDLDVLLSISLALAQGAQLQVLKDQLDWMHQISYSLMQQLEEHGETSLSSKDLTKLLGYIQILRHLAEDTSCEPNLTNSPLFFWDISNVEEQYHATLEHLDFAEDLESWRTKWHLIKETVADDREWQSEKYANLLELMIVIILIVEMDFHHVLQNFGYSAS